jgi:hypothetical protein
MTCLSNLNHLSEDMQSSLNRFLDHPSRSKLRGIHLKIKKEEAQKAMDKVRTETQPYRSPYRLAY